MQYNSLLNLKLSHIQVFLTAAKYENFTRAGNLLHLTQSMVSKIIFNIENELSICLFLRNKDGIKLTPAGKQLYLEWSNILKSIDDSIENAILIQKCQNSRLKIGNSALANSDLFIIEKTNILTKNNPDIVASIEHHTLDKLLEKLTDDNLDIIFTSYHDLPTIEGLNLNWKFIKDTYLSIFIHKNNPLFYKPVITFDDLKSEDFIALSPEQDPNYFNLLNGLSEKHGFKPRISCYVPNIDSFKVNIELGKGIVLADSMCNISTDDIRKYDFNDFKNGIVAAWKKDSSKKQIHEFIKLFK